MAKTDLNTIKTWFQTGDFPTQEQFWNWLDSFWHKDDAISMAVIQGLEDLIAGKATVQDITNVNARIDELEASGITAVTVRLQSNGPVDYLVAEKELIEKVVVIPSAEMDISFGTVAGGDDLAMQMRFAADVAQPVGIEKYAYGAAFHLHITGITASTQVIIYKRK